MPEKMAYKLWVRVNGEEKPLTLTQADYSYLPEPSMTEFSYGFSDGWDFMGSGSNSMVYYYVVGPEAYGVQAIYRGAGEERVSEIAWAETVGMGAEVQPEAATPAYPDVTIGADDNRIGYGYYTGAEVPTSVGNNKKAETYDVAIRLSDPAMVGSAIESITFPLQEMEGVSNISVFLTSQLRVENGKNAADLTVKAVACRGRLCHLSARQALPYPRGWCLCRLLADHRRCQQRAERLSHQHHQQGGRGWLLSAHF